MLESISVTPVKLPVEAKLDGLVGHEAEILRDFSNAMVRNPMVTRLFLVDLVEKLSVLSGHYDLDDASVLDTICPMQMLELDGANSERLLESSNVFAGDFVGELNFFISIGIHRLTQHVQIHTNDPLKSSCMAVDTTKTSSLFERDLGEWFAETETDKTVCRAARGAG